MTLDLPKYAQCLEISSLKLGLALLYVVMNISGTSIVALFSVCNSCSIVNLFVSAHAFSMMSWGYSLHLKNKYTCICDFSKCWVSKCISFSLKNCEYGMDFLRLIGCSEK